MTPKLLRHCAVVRLLARAGPRPRRLIGLEQRQAWAAEIADLDTEIGGQIEAAIARRGFARSDAPELEAQDVAAILDFAIARIVELRVRDGRGAEG